MRKAYKIFALTLLFVVVVSFAYNYNKQINYALFSESINQMLFGLSYIVPLNVFGFIMRSQANTVWERAVCYIYLWFTLTALADELFFDPFKPTLTEHIVGLAILVIIYYYERIKKVRN